MVAAKGFTALKFDLDSMVVSTGDEMNRTLTPQEVERMADAVRATRDAVGPGVDLAFDCHWRFRPSDAVRSACASTRSSRVVPGGPGCPAGTTTGPTLDDAVRIPHPARHASSHRLHRRDQSTAREGPLELTVRARSGR